MKDVAKLLAGVEQAINALPGLRCESARRSVQLADQEVDLDLVVNVKGQRTHIAVEAKTSGYPRDVREAAWEMASLRAATKASVVPLYAAPSISPGSRALLREQGFGYWDEGGSLYLDLPGALYWIDRGPGPAPPRRIRSLFTGKTAQVVHALLLEPQRRWHLRELAEHAEVSWNTVSQVFDYLEAHLWMEKKGKGPHRTRWLYRPGDVLDAWARSHQLSEYRFHYFHVVSRSYDDLKARVVEALTNTGTTYAMTLASGALLVAPHITGTRHVHCVVESLEAAQQAADAARMKPAVEGAGNVAFMVPKDRGPLLYRQQVEDTWVVSNVQLYVDLMAWPMRGKEQAAHLRQLRLPY